MNFLIVGNWKMNTTPSEGLRIVDKICLNMKSLDISVDVLICPPFTHLVVCSELIRHLKAPLRIGAQNCSSESHGAFTGEISAQMLRDLDVEYIIIGHSERRTIFNETNDTIVKKCIQALDAGIIPIVCIGESMQQRQEGQTLAIIKSQIHAICSNEIIVHHEFAHAIIFAYEPIWAIGTGIAAKPEQAEEVHIYIRTLLKEYFPEFYLTIPLLYGGSVNEANAKEFFSKKDINGALVGGASLKAESFIEIAKATYR
jgi:triosephosphate isomerase